MAEFYNAPYLKNYYCKNCCPIGKDREIATEIKDIQDTTVNLIFLLKKHNITEIADTLVEIAADRIIDDTEIADFERIVRALEEIGAKISELKLLYEQATGGGTNGKGKTE